MFRKANLELPSFYVQILSQTFVTFFCSSLASRNKAVVDISRIFGFPKNVADRAYGEYREEAVVTPQFFKRF